jgi:hypothetical protein
MSKRSLNGRKDGASRCYRLAPVSADDAFEYVAGKLRERGWTPVEEDVSIQLNDAGTWVCVALWAIPPAKVEEEVSA